ncbi:MAG: dihydrodipicolinate synthase family protein [Gemmatimonadota bacterium]|nr:dihydrodipicolinate synthase family protein [Gemmatimonadota bacterium]
MATASSIDLSGVFIPATSPFDPVSGDLDVIGLRSNVRRWSTTGVRGIVIGGSTGEAMLLDDDERLAALDATADILPDGILLVAGTGGESTRRTIRLTREAAEHGADAVLVQPPAFYKGAMTPEALQVHYAAVADASPVPVIVYQVPLRLSTLDLPTGLVVELSKHPNIVGIKDSRGQLELVGELATQTARGFQVLVGSGAHLYASLEVGAVGGILGVANLAPAESAAICTAFQRGDHAGAGRLQKEVGPVHVEIVGGLGVAGVKAGLDLLGYRGGDPRPPLRPLPERGRETVHKVLRSAGLLEPDRAARA